MEEDEMKRKNEGRKKSVIFITAVIVFSSVIVVSTSETVIADTYDGEDLALAILANASTLIDTSYYDTDPSGHRQSAVLQSLGILSPTDGSTFALFSTGIAGANPVTTNQYNPGSERGTWFEGGKYGYPRDEVTLTMLLQVPAYMHYLYYDVQFFSAEYPEYVGSQYNDKLTITVDSPSKGTTYYVFDINSGYFVLDSHGLTGTGFDVFAQSGNPGGVDWIDTTPRTPGADAGASDLIPIGGATHPVSPHEQITVTINIKDVGDNQFDSAAFIDNLMFTGYAKTDIVARKTVQDLNGGDVECNDTLKYTITISNTGTADQQDNPGHEFEDYLPDNTTYVSGSVSATSGVISYLPSENKVIWDGSIPAESSVSLTFQVTVNDLLPNGSLISNQGMVYWDSDEDGTNDATEVTDDPHVDDGIDQDGDGETGDDDPTNLYVVSFDPPSSVVEDFSDDTPGEKATQYYLGRKWFETDEGVVGSVFQVVAGYHNTTPQAFKTKLRFSGSPQYWYYNISNLESFFSYWEISFKCGNTSEESDLYLNFTNSNGYPFARLKFSYVQNGTNPPVDYVLKLYYWSKTTNAWVSLNTDTEGYLYNHWYTLKLERIGLKNIRFYLYKQGTGLVDVKEDYSLVGFVLERDPGSTFSNLAYIEWRNTKNPVVCPMFFWDEHHLGLVPG